MENTTEEVLGAIKIFYILSLVPISTLIVISCTCCMYFLSCLRFYIKKIRQLQGNDGSFYGSLIHSRVELRKSVLIILILIFEVICFLSMLASILYVLIQSRVPNRHTNSSCTMSIIDSYRYSSLFYRLAHAISYSSLSISFGLIAFLFLYLSQSYGYQVRYKYEKQYFVSYIVIQATIIFLVKTFRSTFFTVSFLVFLLLCMSTSFFWVYSKRLYIVLQWRCDDAKFELKDIVNRMRGIKIRYSRTTALFKAIQALTLLSIFFNDFSWQIEVYIGESCIVSEILGVNMNAPIFQEISSSIAWSVFKTLNVYICHIGIGAALLFYISLYLYILFFCLNKRYPRQPGRFKYSGYSDLDQPLVGRQLVVYD